MLRESGLLDDLSLWRPGIPLRVHILGLAYPDCARRRFTINVLRLANLVSTLR